MTLTKLLAVFVLFFASYSAIGQREQVAGQYARNITINKTGVITYNLSLNSDSTFLFEYTRKIDANHPKEVRYSKGTWKLLNKAKIKLTTYESIVGQKDVLNLTSSEAHFVTKSPRDKSNRELPTYFKFYDCPIPWVKGVQLVKQ